MQLAGSHLRRVERVAIVGTGLLGGSIGLGLRAAGFAGRVLGIGRRPETLERARRHGCIDEAGDDPADAARRSQLLILATPLGGFAEAFRRLAAGDHAGLVITDVGSTKARVCADAARLLPPAAARRFVGSHPMAGSERHGPEHARADLFRGRSCVVTPAPDADADAVALVEELWLALGMRTLRMTPARHDELAARVSHLPHAAAALLVLLAQSEGGLEIAATGFRDTTRVASGDPGVWADIFDANREAMLAALDGFAASLAGFRGLLAEGEPAAIRDLLARAKDARDTWAAAAMAEGGEA